MPLRLRHLTRLTFRQSTAVPATTAVYCTLAEGYADVKSQKDGLIPAQVATFLYASESAMEEGKTPIQGVEDFNTTFSSLELTVVDYETKTAEELLIGAVYDALNEVYPSQVEIVTI